MISGLVLSVLAVAAHAFSAADLAALKKLQSRLEQGLTQVATHQQHALDDEMCKCTSSNGFPQLTLLGDFVKEHCGGWGADTQCRGQLFQEVKRIAPYHQTLDIAGVNFTEANMKSLKRVVNGYLDEQRTLLSRVRSVVAALDSPDSAHGIVQEEIADRVEMAAKIEMSPDRSMILRVGVRAHFGLEPAAPSCECFHVKQARYFWDDAADTEAATTSAFLGSEGAGHALNFAMPDMSWTSTLDRFAREESQKIRPSIVARMLGESAEEEEEVTTEMLDGDKVFLEALEKAGKKYAKKYPMLTWYFLLCFDVGGIAIEPYCNSGPPFPRYTIESCGCHWAPSSNVYGEGYCFPFALSGIFYFASCPYGLFTSKPELLASMAVNPSGRQWPERTVCSSHPSGSSNSDGNANDEFFEIFEKMNKGATGGAAPAAAPAEDPTPAPADPTPAPPTSAPADEEERRLAGADENLVLYGNEGKALASANARMFFAPNANVYDARLVSGLYDFHAQGAAMIRVTLFTTALHQFSWAGLNPKGSDYQHLGLTIEFSKPVHFAGGSWRFLTLEMMAQGMMWTVNADSEPTKNYDYQKKLTLTYDNLSPKIVARYLAEQQGRTYQYGKTDCQTVAMELASRLALHGRRLGSQPAFTEPVAHTYLILPTKANPVPMLQKKVYELMRGDTNKVQLDVQEPTAVCPQPVPQTRVMTDAAREAWAACASPLALTPVSFRSPLPDFEELKTTLEIMSDVETSDGINGFFMSHPMESQASFLHGPTHAEYKDFNKAQLNGCIVFTLLLVAALLVVIAVLARKAAPAISARAPFLKKAAMPLLFGVSVLSGTVFAPFAVGGYWYSRHRKAASAHVQVNMDETEEELTADAEE
jgi:hypothetical protein